MSSAHDWVNPTVFSFPLPNDFSVVLLGLGYKYLNGNNARCDECDFVYQRHNPKLVLSVELFSTLAVTHANDQPLCAVADCHFNFTKLLNGEDEWVKKCIFDAAKEMLLLRLKEDEHRFE